MNRNENIKEKKIFSILLIASYIIVTFFLVFTQYISSTYMNALVWENHYLVKENVILTTGEKISDSQGQIIPTITKDGSTLFINYLDKNDGALAEGYTTMEDFLKDPKNKGDYNIRSRIGLNAHMAYRNGTALVIFVLCLGVVLSWYIIRQFRQLSELNIKLDIAEKNAQEALIVKENFLANMSHEIRTPLNSILGFTKIIQRRNAAPDISEFAGAIGHAGENLLRIVNDVLDLSKMEAGMLQIIKTPFNVRDFMHLIESLFKERINEKDLTLTIDIDEEVPDFLLGDATRLTQILANLIGNAIKFSSQGEIRISVTSESIEQHKAMLKFKVTDEGIGIDSEKLDLIFERFRQAEESISRKYGGTGLGLSIVKNLIHLQNGTINVNSEPGVGTEISFEIPYDIVKDAPATSFNATASSVVTAIQTSIHLLVVDDNIMNQTFIRHVLSEWNITFTIASNGAEAINLLQHKNFDIVLMDIQMPQMDGYAATQYIRENLGLKIPIIAMTAHALQGEKEKCINNGMDGYISKPINDTELFEILSGFMTIIQNKKDGTSTVASKYIYINLTYIKEISNGSIVYEKVVTRQFIETIPLSLSNMITAYQNKDFKEINSIAHHMQTSMAIMGLLSKCGSLLDRLEFTGSNDDDIAAVIDRLAAICENAVAEARDFYSSLK